VRQTPLADRHRSAALSSLILELRASSSASAAPTEFRIFAAGKNESTKGSFNFDEKSAKAVMAAAAERGVDIPIDYAHGTTDPMGMLNPEMAGKAAGWCSLELRDGELWAVNVRWTKNALAAIEAKEWRYISPTFAHDKDNRPQVLLAVALENVPALHNLEPLVAASAGVKELSMDAWVPMCFASRCSVTSLACQGCPAKVMCASLCYGTSVPPDPPASVTPAQMQMSARESFAALLKEHSMKTVLAALKLSETASEAEALAAVTALAAQVQSTGTDVAPLLALTGKTTVPEAIGAVQALKAEAEKAAALSAKIAEIEKAAVEAERTSLIEEGKKSGKLAPALEAWAKSLPVESLKAFLAAATPVVTPLGAGKGEPKVDPAAPASADEKTIAATLGVKPEDVKARAAK
jgi:phage I-like protein